MSETTSPQPSPTPNSSTPIADLVIEDIRQRKVDGIAKYKTPLQAFNGRNALIDRYQELLDAVQYTRQEIEEQKQIDSGFVSDALRTEPDYAAALTRLQNPKIARLLHVAMGLATEAGEFLDALKKHIFYGRPVDTVNLIEEIGDVSWYQRIGCDELEISFTEMLLRNVRKLRARFPEKFTEGQANERNLDAERKTLEAAR